MSEAEKTGDTPQFLLSQEFRDLSRKSFERHTATPDVSSDTYFATRIGELRKQLASKTLIYLDTCHWVHLRHVELCGPRQQPGYAEILDELKTLHAQKRICCPISFLLFLELMKQRDPTTRLRTAQLMDYFSDGVCFQFPPELAQSELRHCLLRTVAKQSNGPKAWVLTKVGFLTGELLPSATGLPAKADNRVQKAWIDLMWAARLEHIVENLDSNWPESDFWQKYAAASNMDAEFYRNSKMKYADVLAREKALLVRGLLREDLEVVGREIWDAFPECRSPTKSEAVSEFSPHNFPSLQILAGISAADMVTKVKFEANDMLDFRHTAIAIPYCHAVFCDNPMATRLRNKPCEFGKVYGTEILGKPKDILLYLRGLRA